MPGVGVSGQTADLPGCRRKLPRRWPTRVRGLPEAASPGARRCAAQCGPIPTTRFRTDVPDHRQWPAEYSRAMDGAPGIEREQSAPSTASPPLGWAEGHLPKMSRFRTVFRFQKVFRF